MFKKAQDQTEHHAVTKMSQSRKNGKCSMSDKSREKKTDLNFGAYEPFAFRSLCTKKVVTKHFHCS